MGLEASTNLQSLEFDGCHDLTGEGISVFESNDLTLRCFETRLLQHSSGELSWVFLSVDFLSLKNEMYISELRKSDQDPQAIS